MVQRLLALLVAIALALPPIAQARLWRCREHGALHPTCCCDDRATSVGSIDACCEQVKADEDHLFPAPPLLEPPAARWNLIGALGPPTPPHVKHPRPLWPPVPVARGPPLYLVNASLLR